MKKLFPICWALLAGAILALDYLTGAIVRLDVLLIFPVAFASWFNGRCWGLVLAIVAPLVHLSYHFAWTSPATLSEAIINTVVRVFALSAFAILLDLVARQKAQIRVLEGILPICAWCKQIRDEGGQWHRIESYIGERTDAKFSHGICPECHEKYIAGQLK